MESYTIFRIREGVVKSVVVTADGRSPQDALEDAVRQRPNLFVGNWSKPGDRYFVLSDDRHPASVQGGIFEVEKNVPQPAYTITLVG